MRPLALTQINLRKTQKQNFRTLKYYTHAKFLRLKSESLNDNKKSQCYEINPAPNTPRQIQVQIPATQQ